MVDLYEKHYLLVAHGNISCPFDDKNEKSGNCGGKSGLLSALGLTKIESLLPGPLVLEFRMRFPKLCWLG